MSEVTTPPPRPEAPGRRREMIAAMVVIGLLTATVVGKRVAHALAPAPSEQQCADLLDHYLAQASRQKHPDVKDEDVKRAQQSVHGQRSQLVEVDRCRHQLSASQVECALRSVNVDELERCLQ